MAKDKPFRNQRSLIINTLTVVQSTIDVNRRLNRRSTLHANALLGNKREPISTDTNRLLKLNHEHHINTLSKKIHKSLRI